MEIKVPDPKPLNEAIDAIQLKPQYFFIAGLFITVIAIFDRWSAIGLGIASAGAFIGAAWLQTVIMKGFLEHRPTPPEPAPLPPTPVRPPPPPPLPEMPQSIDLEPPPTQPQHDPIDPKYAR